MIDRPDEVVAAAYNLLFDREPDPAGLKHWSSSLSSGLSRTEFLRAMLTSAEFRQRMIADEPITRYGDVDLIIPTAHGRLKVPASDTSLVPHLLAHRCWEPHIHHWLTRTLRPSDVFVDVGANVGYFTVLCAPRVARVVAFEPTPVTYGYCRANVALNGLTNVDLFDVGLWHEDATLPVSQDASSLMTAAVNVGGSAGGETIRVVSLDALVRRDLCLPRLDVIKMDIEGAELAALNGMQETLARLRPAIVMELNRPALAACGATHDQVWDFFARASYELRAFAAWDTRDPVPLASIDELEARCPEDTLIDVLAVPLSS
jgi:FkbM family methyltransferase